MPHPEIEVVDISHRPVEVQFHQATKAGERKHGRRERRDRSRRSSVKIQRIRVAEHLLEIAVAVTVSVAKRIGETVETKESFFPRVDEQIAIAIVISRDRNTGEER